MSWTKQELVEEAFSVLALSGFVFDITPEEMQMGLRRLDSMMGTWDEHGIKVGYPLAASPSDSCLDMDSNLPASAIEAVYMNLAIRIASSFGKTLPPDVKETAKAGYEVLLGRAAMPAEVQYPATLPRGAGNKTWRTTHDPFMERPDTSPLGVASNGELEIRGD